MPNSSKTKFNEIDQSFSIDSVLKGLAAVSLQTLRGPFGHDGEVMTSWPEFKKKYGGEVEGLEGPTLAKRALSRGAQLRINKVGHYTNAADASTLDAVKAAFPATLGSESSVTAESYFTLQLKYAGKDYNNIVAIISEASNGDAAAFNLAIEHLEDSSINELYENLKVTATTVAESKYLDDVIGKSKIVDVTYLDNSADTKLKPDAGTFSATGGSDGTAPTSLDYAGDEAGGTGPYAFDSYEDFEVIASLDNSETAVATAMGNYAAAREDCVAIIHLPNSLNTVAALKTERDSIGLDTRFAYFVTGGLKINDPFVAGKTREISELGDVIGAAMRSSVEFGEWYSFAGTQRGFITNALGVVNNFGTAGSAKLDQLAQRQINVVVNKNGTTYIKGNFSAQKANSRKSFINVVKLLIHIKKSLGPAVEKYLEQPNDFRTFREIYNEVQPYFQSLVSQEKRALIDYDWKGDQFANSDSELTVNTREELDQGKYKVELYLKEIVSLQEFTINIISAPSGVSFEDNLN